ncbi:hypothetical protein [Variovorax guangxiensis]|uniref:hypothetical protein n=1 Tax=Variovorax guangxiensis TaxID=1775474 RepID=UPI00285AF67D|nr:hypothetical protein [Variovorax guangxiensis]MDR6854595.1 hypothetical protein [Variovorax guangxiensis]
MHDAHNFGLEILGKTLNLGFIITPARAMVRARIMFSLLALVARLFRSKTLEIPASPAAALMESADSRAGMNAHQAQELRAAASAWLSVVR